ncbi:MAG TPA: uroporphyrinogen-III synthase [Azospira sp.]|nr:uroporphyrinogen-III synthase [Azospira sp.]
MNPAQPLAQRTIVVTRPRAQAASLAQAIAAAGGTPLIYPLLEIDAADLGPLQAVAPHLADYAIVFCVSPNAVEHALPTLLAAGPWPAATRPASVGLGTEKAYARFGLTQVIAPRERFDSEALLELPEFQAEAVNGKKVLILRGDGGRELVRDTLEARGATVDVLTCYHRRPPAQGPAPLLDAWAAGRLDALTVSSSEALRYLWDLLDAQGRGRLAATPVFVPHARIADAARGLGLAQVVLTPPADAGLIAGLCAYNWPQ